MSITHRHLLTTQQELPRSAIFTVTSFEMSGFIGRPARNNKIILQ